MTFVAWLFFRSVKGTVTSLALTTAALVGALVTSFSEPTALVALAATIVENVFPCSGGCGVARFEGALTATVVLSLVVVLVPVARALCSGPRFQGVLAGVFGADA
jgi:hypothetical protein